MSSQAHPVVGYVDRLSVRPGEQVSLHLSGPEREVSLALVRVLHGDLHPDGPGREEVEVPCASLPATTRIREQEVRLGSAMVVSSTGPPVEADGLTLHAWAKPTLDGGFQAVLSAELLNGKHLSLGLLDSRPAVRLGEVGREAEVVCLSDQVLPSHRWYSLTARLGDGKLQLEAVPDAPVPGESPARATVPCSARPAGGLEIIVGAEPAGAGSTAAHFNGLVEAPSVHVRALREEELQPLRDGRAPTEGIAAQWDFALGIGSDRGVDVSGNGRHGELSGAPVRGVRGRRWDGRTMTWAADPPGFAAVHFHADDLEDCGWAADATFRLPGDLRSGVYAVRVSTDSGEPLRVPLFVRPAAARRRPPLLFLVPTNTYLAYCGEDPRSRIDQPDQIGPTERWNIAHGFRSSYDAHEDGSQVHIVTARRPLLNLSPDYRFYTRDDAYLLGADLHLLRFLEHEGFAFDVACDEDLDREGAALLAPYRAVVTGHHPEYVTEGEIQALLEHQRSGGRLAYLGGNGFFFVVARPADRPHLMEMRRPMAADVPAAEMTLATTGERGGEWRERGVGPHHLLGVESNIDDKISKPYLRTPAGHDPDLAWLFADVAPDAPIGNHGIVAGGAAGKEVDCIDARHGTPPNARVVATAEWDVPDHRMRMHRSPSRVAADMVYYETPGGGEVFSVGSMLWITALYSDGGYDNAVAAMTRNVLRRFTRE